MSLTDRPDLLYLAAPFFNEAQVRTCARIETLCASLGIGLISPRKMHGDGPTPKITTAAAARRVFNQNCQDLARCSGMIAVLDYPIPDMELRLVRNLHATSAVLASGPLFFPDTGVIFEMGKVFGSKPIAGFTTRADNPRLNLMLSQACDGFIYGFDHLGDFLTTNCEESTGARFGFVNWACLKPWMGGHV